MPRLDGTGPQGMGPMTGRGMGYCTGYVSNPSYFGAGRRAGGGFGQDSMYNPRGLLRPRFIRPGAGRMPVGYAENPYNPLTKEEELTNLTRNKKDIETQLKGIEKRIEELSK